MVVAARERTASAWRNTGPSIICPSILKTPPPKSADPLEASYQQALTIASELIAFCRAHEMPFGINVESVSIRRVEIEASVRLAQQLRSQLNR